MFENKVLLITGGTGSFEMQLQKISNKWNRRN